MQGHTTSDTISVWFLFKDTKKAEITLTGPDNYNKTHKVKFNKKDTQAGFFPYTVTFEGLKERTIYNLMLRMDGKFHKVTYPVKTFAAEVTEYSFMTGACAFQAIGPEGVSAGKDTIFYPMAAMPTDFMLWLGDAFYYIAGEEMKLSSMMRRQVIQRILKPINLFLKSRPQYQIWDDHDYGPNDAGIEFKNKDISLMLHKKFWPNPYYGTDKLEGNFCHFSYGDSDFFLLDNRFYRTKDDAENRAILGDAQLNWLEERLKESKAVFKFIAIGNQVLNDKEKVGSYCDYPEEQKKLYDIINKNKIKGVIFLSGDRHHTELIKKDNIASYPLYDFTCSPLTSWPSPSMVDGTSSEIKNPYRVPGTLYVTFNWGIVYLSGEKGKRICTIRVYNEHAGEVWKYDIAQKELGY
jgi:alkaline phosphatase D